MKENLISLLERRIDTLRTNRDIFHNNGDVLEVLRLENEMEEAKAIIAKLRD